MISIQKSLMDLESLGELQKATTGCYRDAIECIARYAVDVDQALIQAHRAHLTDLARRLDNHENVEAILSIRPDLRGELRDYRDRVGEFVEKLRGELAYNARALQDMIDALSEVPEDPDEPVKAELKKLRTLARTIPRPEVATAVTNCAEGLEVCLEQMREQHRATIGQFLVEIRMLHQRIGTLQQALASDAESKLLSRHEFEARIPDLLSTGDGRSAILFHAVNLFQIERMYGADIAAQVVAALGKRLENQVPKNGTAVRWTKSEFVVLVSLDRSASIQFGKDMAVKFGGTYSCMESGRSRTVTLRVSYGVVDCTEVAPGALAGRLDGIGLGKS